MGYRVRKYRYTIYPSERATLRTEPKESETGHCGILQRGTWTNGVENRNGETPQYTCTHVQAYTKVFPAAMAGVICRSHGDKGKTGG